jgi:L-lysine exporter family protein LysE/ArgO
LGTALLHGLVLSFGLILPLGAQNTFVLTQGALHRRWTGALPSVLTAAVSDTLLITLAVSGLSLVLLTVPWLQMALQWCGVLFLLYMGWSTWRAAAAVDRDSGGTPGTARGAAPGGGPSGPAGDAAPDEAWPARRQVAFAASVSLLNPHAILDTVAVIGTGALAYTGTARLAFSLACIAVSWVWFFGLSLAGHLMGVLAAGANLQRWLIRASAVIMWGVALQLLRSLLLA